MGVEKGKYESPEGSRTWEYLATIACSFLMFCIGSAMGWNSPSSVKLMSEESPVRLGASDLSNLMSLLAVGQLVAPPLNSAIVDRIGRKNTILIVGLPLLVSWSLITIADNVWILYIARLAAGLSQGIGYCVCYMYVGEIASTENRGFANVLTIIMFNLGMLLAFVVVPCLSIALNAWLNFVLVLAFIGCFWFMPESPYFLAMTGRDEEAEEVLSKLRGKRDVADEMELIERSLRSDRKQLEGQRKATLWMLLRNRASLKGVVIIGLFSVSHHFGGNVTVLTYGQKIFKDLQIRIMTDHLANVINGVIQLLSVCLITPLVDGWGRRPLIAVSGVSAGFCNLVVGVYFYFQEYTNIDVSNYSWIPMVAVFLIIFAFNCGLQIVQSILISEVFAPEFKALGVCVVIMNGGLMYTIGSKMYLMITDTWHYGNAPPFLTFVVVVWAMTALLMWITPETKGKTLLEIQKALLE